MEYLKAIIEALESGDARGTSISVERDIIGVHINLSFYILDELLTYPHKPVPYNELDDAAKIALRILKAQ